MSTAMPPAAWKWFTSASPPGYMRVSSGVTFARSAKSSQVSSIPAAAATAIRCRVWLVEPPVASSATTALTIAFSSITRPIGVYSSPCAVISTARRPAAAVSASRSGVPGLTNVAPGRWRPITSTSTWLELAVP